MNRKMDSDPIDVGFDERASSYPLTKKAVKVRVETAAEGTKE